MLKRPFITTFKSLFSTINKKQMEQFDKITSWWHPSSQMNVLFQYNYKRIQFLRDVLKRQNKNNYNLIKPLQNLKAIDVGCGAGFLSQSLTRLGATVVGLDPNRTSFNEATSHRQKNQQTLQNLSYHNSSIQQYLQSHKEQKSSKDLITSMDVIEHVDNPTAFINSLVQSLKPNGLIMLSTISKTLYSFVTHIVVAQYITGLVPKGTHNYNKFINPQRLCMMLESAGVEVLEVRQLQYNWRGQFQTKRGGANYMVIGKKIAQNGSNQQAKIQASKV